MLVLGMETSCDETAVAIVENGKKICANIVSSQLKLHHRFGGVVPELASRAHLESLPLVLRAALRRSNLSLTDIKAIAVTYGPGLIGCLIVGVSLAKSLSYALSLPLIGVNHLEGHLHSYLLTSSLSPPFIGLVVSGGHTSLILVKDYGDYRSLGETRDDAAGEAYDKVARMLKLGYPGGPLIEKLAREGNPESVKFPRALPNSLDFSFSGLKTAVLYYIQKCGIANPADIAASFQAAVVDVLVKKSLMAVEKTGVEKIVLGGGVAANETLRRALKEAGKKKGIKVYIPPKRLATDNAAMVAAIGYYYLQRGERSDPFSLDAISDLRVESRERREEEVDCIL
ncbi:MAG: tRNA N6-adenosine threonylcarbamoyltransferase [Syntrophomonadaceae bacterium]|nr:tRNA N6-adenosine threonylcarbamoyltransferase [Bacillota bacterium]MBT9138675.1 tRNA N6-adenosine threonylcarbamoyltransferase [Bacillota bacterium]